MRTMLLSTALAGALCAFVHPANAGPIAVADAWVSLSFSVVGEALDGMGGAQGPADQSALQIVYNGGNIVTSMFGNGLHDFGQTSYGQYRIEAMAVASLSHPGVSSATADVYLNPLTLQNTSGHSIVVMRRVDYATDIGDYTQIDWPSSQSASFVASTAGQSISSTQSCFTGLGEFSGSGMVTSGGGVLSCFIGNADFSSGDDLIQIDPFQSIEISGYEVHATANVAWVPEPMSASLLGFGVLGLAATRRRR
jgi:hypothetical protein